jgi:hypothetical protein
MNFLKQLFGQGCQHRFAWPRTDDHGHHYQICSRCGIAYEYDWTSMRRTEHLLVAEAQIRHA